MERKIKFIFDLDGTVTREETLPLIASRFNKEKEINNLTFETIQGNVPFVESFIKRVYILGKLPIDEVNELLANVKLYDRVVEFIHMHRENCIIATGNLKCWTQALCEKVGCEYYGSDCIINENKVVKLTKILRKERIVEKYKEEGYKIVFIGDGNNDLEGMRLADVAIAVGMTHSPAQSVLTVANYVTFTEEALCRLLNQLS